MTAPTPRATGQEPDLMQGGNRGFFSWLANRADARRLARENAVRIKANAARYDLIRAWAQCDSKRSRGLEIGDARKARAVFMYWGSPEDLDRELDQLLGR